MYLFILPEKKLEKNNFYNYHLNKKPTTMKKFFLGLSVLTVAGLTANAQVKPTTTSVKHKTSMAKPAVFVLKSQVDSFSYALGMNIANNLQQQGIDDVNYAAMQKAMKDVYKKDSLLLDEKQANSTIQAKLKENQDKKAAKVKAEGQAFLAANGKRPGVVTLPSGLQYEILKKSDSVSASPTLQDTVVTNYKGTLIDGTEFDNSYKRGQPLTLPVGGVIKGWTEALQLMHVGDKWKIYIPSELGYGERGAGQAIPGGATLIFEMELLAIKPAVAKTK
jgi:FKBP-type peptidyl-prolyl cis-trans isomerase FklB